MSCSIVVPVRFLREILQKIDNGEMENASVVKFGIGKYPTLDCKRNTGISLDGKPYDSITFGYNPKD